MTQDKMNDVFSKYMDKIYGGMYISDNSTNNGGSGFYIFNADSSGNTEMIGKLVYIFDFKLTGHTLILNNNTLKRRIRNTFGNEWVNLVLTYFQQKFPKYDIQQF
jgi:hypothetical protein